MAKRLISLGHNVIIGSGAEQLEFFKKEIPGIKCISFPGFTIRYSSWLPQYLVIILNSPVFIYSILKEHSQLKKILTEHKIDIVISDSRPGLWNGSVKTVFVTHMIRIPLPRWASLIEKTGLLSSKIFIRKFTFCFIPDLEKGNDLSGKLSHDLKLPDNARYIGILSRFSAPEIILPEREPLYFCTVILSGPEPQRTMMKEKMSAILGSYGKKSFILEGKPGSIPEKHEEGNITYISHLPTTEMREYILSSRFIVSRSGYTSLMELASMEKDAVIIPTPGQTEQEYLAEYLSGKGWFRAVSQQELSPDIFNGETASLIPADLTMESEKLLARALGELLEEDHK
jgi:UDP-N-acetylglucosamine transferase subunit ALG13